MLKSCVRNFAALIDSLISSRLFIEYPLCVRRYSECCVYRGRIDTVLPSWSSRGRDNQSIYNTIWSDKCYEEKQAYLKNKEWWWGLRRDYNRLVGQGGDDNQEVSCVNNQGRACQLQWTASSQVLRLEHAFIFELWSVRKFRLVGAEWVRGRAVGKEFGRGKDQDVYDLETRVSS